MDTRALKQILILPTFILLGGLAGSIFWGLIRGAPQLIGFIALSLGWLVVGHFLHLLYKVVYFHHGRDMISTLLYNGPVTKEPEYFRKAG